MADRFKLMDYQILKKKIMMILMVAQEAMSISRQQTLSAKTLLHPLQNLRQREVMVRTRV